MPRLRLRAVQREPHQRDARSREIGDNRGRALAELFRPLPVEAHQILTQPREIRWPWDLGLPEPVNGVDGAVRESLRQQVSKERSLFVYLRGAFACPRPCLQYRVAQFTVLDQVEVPFVRFAGPGQPDGPDKRHIAAQLLHILQVQRDEARLVATSGKIESTHASTRR